MDIDGPPVVLTKFTAEKDNKTYKIRIQHVTRNLIDDILDHMTEYFLAREPITSISKMASDPPSLNSMRALWRDAMVDGPSIVAILEDENSGTPQNIVGVNVTTVTRKGDTNSFEPVGESYIKVLGTMSAITTEGNLFERFGVDRYLTAYGLSVHPDYHGLGIGLKLLEAREPLCKAIGLKLTGTVFTAAASQYLASKAGFEVIAEHYYKDHYVNGVICFPELKGKVTLMAKSYH